MTYGPPPGPQPNAPGRPATSSQSEPRQGPGLAIASVVLGLIAFSLPMMPMAMDGVRQYVAFPLSLGGLVLSVGALVGRRRGMPIAVVGTVVCGLAVCLGLFMVAGRL